MIVNMKAVRFQNSDQSRLPINVNLMLFLIPVYSQIPKSLFNSE